MEEDAANKTYDPTPKKLEDARKKGEIARSVDLQSAAGYAGLILALFAAGQSVVQGSGSALMTLLDQSAELSEFLSGDTSGQPLMGETILGVLRAVFPVFLFPATLIVLTIIVQRAFVFTPSKLEPKISRISLISNAKNKFGRSGLFEFAKSFTKLVIFSVCLATFINIQLPNILLILEGGAGTGLAYLGQACMIFLLVVFCVSAVIGGIDYFWQQAEHIRKNRMSHKELMDENKEAEGDPYLKQERRSRAQAVATAQMMGQVPAADVVIVNPSHYAVALKWARLPGTAPECIAKGVDEVALRIREVAQEHAVPIHSDPPTARALHALTEIGQEIDPDHYETVAAAIRFADQMRERARQRVY